MFREAGLGPLIGKRSWGGVVGISNRGQLIDGGGISVPESGFANTKGEWVIEGYGVDPDIEVDNDPKSVLDGKGSPAGAWHRRNNGATETANAFAGQAAGPVKTIK